MTTTAPAAPTTADLNGITIQLDNLYNAYAAMLEQAKQQLENLELSESQVDRIADCCSRRLADDVTGDVISRLYDQFRREMLHAEDTDTPHWLLDALERRVSSTVTRRITSEIEATVEESARSYLESGSFSGYMNDAVSRELAHPNGVVGRRFRHRVREAIGELFTADDIREALGLNAFGQAQ